MISGPFKINSLCCHPVKGLGADLIRSNPSDAITVLVVDDDVGILEVSRELLTEFGKFRVETSTSGTKALEAMNDDPYDAIVSDYEMPGMDGIELLRRIRTNGSNIPFILFTGKGREEVAIKALNGGADFYLQKGGDIKSLFIELSHKIRMAVERRRADIALQQSEYKYRTLVETSPETIWEIDMEGIFTYVSSRVKGMLGHSPEDVVGRSVFSFVERSARDPLLQLFLDHIAKKGRLLTTEVPMVDDLGEIHIVEIHSSSIVDDQGNMMGFRGVARDITERKIIEERLVHSYNLLHYIISHAWSAIAVLDRDLRYVYVSDRFLDDYGIRGLDVIGKRHYDLFPNLEDRLKDVHQRALKGEISRKEDDPYRRADGSIDWISWECRPWYELDGRIGGIVLYSENINERKRTEEMLRSNEVQLAEAMDLAKLVNWVYDVKRDVFIFNDRFYSFHGATAEEMGGYEMTPERYSREFVHPEDAHMVAEEVQRTIATADPAYMGHTEHRIIRKDGVVRHVVVRYSMVMDDEGNVLMTKGANQDITDRVLVEEALRRANRRLNILSSITSHDVMNKITVILGNIEMARKKHNDPTLEKLLSTLERATVAIKSQITFTRMYEDLGTGVQTWQVLDTMMPLSQLPDHIIFKTDLGNIEIYADPMFEKVFSNLLDNSVRHGGHVNNVTVTSVQDGDFLVVVWEDDGIGITEADKKRIFDPGFGKNTGYGLFLTKEILDITGLTIRECGTEGRGARFEIRVPPGKWRLVRQ